MAGDATKGRSRPETAQELNAAKQTAHAVARLGEIRSRLIPGNLPQPGHASRRGRSERRTHHES